MGLRPKASIEIYLKYIVIIISFHQERVFRDKKRKHIARAFRDFCATHHFVLFFLDFFRCFISIYFIVLSTKEFKFKIKWNKKRIFNVCKGSFVI